MIVIDTWIYFAVLAGFASNLYNIFNRHVLKDSGDSTAYAWWTEFIRLAIAILIVAVDFSFTYTFQAFLILLLLGLVEVVSAFIFMKMHQYSHLSISTIISRTRLIWIPIIAFLFLGESLTSFEYFGIVILFLGLSIAVSPHKLKVDKGVQLSYLSAIVVAILSVVMKAASPLVSTSVLLFFMSVTSVIILPLFMKNAQKRITNTIKKNFWAILLASISNTAAMYLYVYALRLGEVSKVTGIYQGMMIVSIIGGIVLLRERQDVFKKIIGAIITIVGILILSIQ